MAEIDPGPPLVSMAQQFTGLPMYNLIGAPLMAAAKANGAMAVTQTKFLIDTCFYPAKKDSPDADDKDDPIKSREYKPVMIEMSLERSVIAPATDQDPQKKPVIETFTTKFYLPLLTILPLNSLAVETVDVDFNMEVKSSYSQMESKKTEEKFEAGGSWEAKAGYGPFSASVKGNVSYSQDTTQNNEKHYEKSNSANYNVKVHAGQLPLPQGVTTIIQAYANNIQPIVLDTGKTP